MKFVKNQIVYVLAAILLAVIGAMILALSFGEKTEALTHTDHNDGWTVLSASDKTIGTGTTESAPAKYYLNSSVNLGAQKLTIEGYVILCLNGKTLSRTGSGCVVYIASNATLVLEDCSGDKGVITGGTSGGIEVYGYPSKSKLIINGGTIKNNTGENGGGVSCGNNCYVEMNGGAIVDNTASNRGGGIYTTGSYGQQIFVMTGGTISGNKASYGGGISMTTSGSGEISGGTISENTASENGNEIYMSSGTLNITGGEIKTAEESDGECIYATALSAHLYIQNGKFGASINIDETSDCKISGGMFTEFVFSRLLQDGCYFTASGDAEYPYEVVKGDVCEAEVKFDGFTLSFAQAEEAVAFLSTVSTSSEKYAEIKFLQDVSFSQGLSLSGEYILFDLNGNTFSCDITVGQDAGMRLTDSKEGESGVLEGDIVANGSVTVEGGRVNGSVTGTGFAALGGRYSQQPSYVSEGCVIVDISKYSSEYPYLVTEDGFAALVLWDGELYEHSSLADAFTRTGTLEMTEANPATIILLEDSIQADTLLLENAYCTIDLNGRTVMRTGTDKGSVLKFNNSNITLEDSGESNGIITGGTGDPTLSLSVYAYGGGICCTGSLIINGGTITGNSGGGVVVSGGDFVINGGTLVDNGDYYDAYVWNDVTLTMTGGEVGNMGGGTNSLKRPKSLNPQWLKLFGRLLFFNIFTPVLCRFQSVFLHFQDLLSECEFCKNCKIDLQTEKNDVSEPLKSWNFYQNILVRLHLVFFDDSSHAAFFHYKRLCNRQWRLSVRVPICI